LGLEPDCLAVLRDRQVASPRALQDEAQVHVRLGVVGRQPNRFAQRGLPRFAPTSKVGLGALVDVRVEDDDGSEERTVFVLPVGAGTELAGPGGDGFIQVVTPESPVGRGLMGAARGDSFDISTGDVDREWTIVDLC